MPVGDSTEEDLGFNKQQGDDAELVYLLGVLLLWNPDPFSNSSLFRNPASPPDDTQDLPQAQQEFRTVLVHFV